MSPCNVCGCVRGTTRCAGATYPVMLCFEPCRRRCRTFLTLCTSDTSCSQPETDRRLVIGPSSGTQLRLCYHRASRIGKWAEFLPSAGGKPGLCVERHGHSWACCYVCGI